MKALALKIIKKMMPVLLRLFGIPLHDVKTGEFLGRAFVFRWKGKLRVVGLKETIVPSFQPCSGTKYWYQDLGFSRYESPDFSNIREEGPDPSSEKRS